MLVTITVISFTYCNFLVSRPGTRFSKVPKTFRARKAILKLRLAYSVKLVFSYVVRE